MKEKHKNKTKKAKHKQRHKRTRGTEATVKGRELNDFLAHQWKDLWKEFELLQILSELSIKHLIKLTLYENDVKLLKYKRSPL